MVGASFLPGRDDLPTLPLKRVREVHYLGQAIELLLLRARDGELEGVLSGWPGKPPEEAGLSLRSCR